MEYLPPAAQEFLKGGIDPYTQSEAEWFTNVYLTVLVFLSFVASFFAQSVLVALEVFLAGFALLLLIAVPPWPFMNRHAIQFLPVRSGSVKKS